MLQVTSAILSDIFHLYLRTVDVYINVSHLPYMQSIPVLANCHGKQIVNYLRILYTSSKSEMLNQKFMLINVHIR